MASTPQQPRIADHRIWFDAKAVDGYLCQRQCSSKTSTQCFVLDFLVVTGKIAYRYHVACYRGLHVKLRCPDDVLLNSLTESAQGSKLPGRLHVPLLGRLDQPTDGLVLF